MELPELNFEQRGDEVVLLHGKKTVGVYLPSGNIALPWVASLAPVPGLFPDPAVGMTRDTINCYHEISARLWLVGTYLLALSRGGSLLPMFAPTAEAKLREA